MRFEIDYLDIETFKKDLELVDKKLKVKVLKELDVIQKHGIEYVYTKFLRDDIYELKTTLGSNTYRTLFFYNSKKNKYIIVIGGFVKKSQKTPKRKIENAIRLKKEYEKIKQMGNKKTKGVKI